MKSNFLIFIVALVVSNAARAGLCTGSAGCWNIDCNYSVECESAGCGACSGQPLVRLPEPELPSAASVKSVSYDPTANLVLPSGKGLEKIRKN